MKIRKRHIFRLVIDISDKLNIWIQDVFGFNAKRKVLEKKQDFITLKELDNTIGKALGITSEHIERQLNKYISGKKPEEIEKPKTREKTDKKEYQISSKALTDFVSFAQKAKLIIDSKHSKKLSEIDFNELHYSDFEISFDINITNTYALDGELRIYEKDKNTSSEVELAYETFKATFYLIITKLINKDNIHLYINLLNEPDIDESFFNYYENSIDLLLESEHTEGEFSQPYDEKYYFKDGDREIDDDIGWRDFEAFEEFDGVYLYLPPIDIIEILDGIDSIKIKGNTLSYKFNRQEEFKHLVVMLMASYQKDIAEQINQALS